VIAELLQDWKKHCTEENFIGIGSTRKVFRYGDYVIKVNLHEMGYSQSLKEQQIYEYMKFEGYGHLFAQVYFVNEEVCIQAYYNALPMFDHLTFDVKEREGYWKFPNQYEDCIEILDKKFDSFDFKDSSNYGLNENQELVLIDYGMSKDLYNEQWILAVERGEVPHIEVHECVICGIKKEIRTYGKTDHDKRCLKCGKE